MVDVRAEKIVWETVTGKPGLLRRHCANLFDTDCTNTQVIESCQMFLKGYIPLSLPNICLY